MYNQAMLDSTSAIRQAVASAKSGDKAQALHILLALVEQDQYNARAWVLISRLVENHEDQFIALENALTLLPDDEKLTARREALLKAHPDLNQESAAFPYDLDHAIRLANNGQKEEAVFLLRELSRKNPEVSRIWLELARLESAMPARISAAEQALATSPDSSEAQKILKRLREKQENPFIEGDYLEAQGEFEQALDLYTSVAALSRLPTERIEARRRIDLIQIRQDSHKAQMVHPNLNLWRLTLGPLLLFLLMVLMQSGLKLNHIPILAVPGIISITLGSMLVAITEMIPAHPAWVKWFGRPGAGDEPEMRRWLRLLGWAMLLAPYTIFFLEAGRRLGELQASMLPLP